MSTVPSPLRQFSLSPKRLSAVFALTMTVAALFALYTNHAWEDWYITYRASKNLAMGNGLVFTIGDRLHTFTSPLGTLAPALLAFVTAGSSDDLVLWLFRLLSCSLLATAAVILLKFAERTGSGLFAALFTTALCLVDVRIIDFSINGMETGFMVVFLALTVFTLATTPPNFVTILGLAWAGLMWSRPDSFVYIGGLALGFVLFKPVSRAAANRKELLKKLLLAGLVTTAAYLPWTLWTWYYYGTPVPHTIVAKGLFSSMSVPGLLTDFLVFPYHSLLEMSSMIDTFMPPYFRNGGWSSGIWFVSRVLGLMTAYYWLLPKGRPDGRAISFALFLAHFYLTELAAYVAPWYVPNVTFLSIIVLGQIVQQLLSSAPGFIAPTAWTRTVKTVGAAIIFGSFLMTVLVGYQLKLQQEIIELGNRKQIGLWLRENAQSKNDTVFLECLGYIGFYSGLKMYDMPGMSSRETVAAQRQTGSRSYAGVIGLLLPDWLVLRPREALEIQQLQPELLASHYRLAKIFDVSDRIMAHKFLPGRPYLQYDQTFAVYRRI